MGFTVAARAYDISKAEQRKLRLKKAGKDDNS